MNIEVGAHVSVYWERIAFLLLVAFVSLSSTGIHSQTLREDSVLLDKPDGAQTASRFKAGTSVKLLKRQGFWVEVVAAGKSGWLKVSVVQFGGALSGSTAIDTGRLGTGNIVSTSAARGMSAKDLLEGKPNYQQANKLEGLTSDPAGIQAFRVQGGVQPISGKVSLVTSTSTASSAVAERPLDAAGASPTKKKGEDDW